MDESNPIYQAIDLGGGQCCDIAGILRELRLNGIRMLMGRRVWFLLGARR